METKYIFTEDRIQKSLSTTNQIKKLTLNVATSYNTALLGSYSASQTLILKITILKLQIFYTV